MTLPLRRRRETEWVDLPVVHPANVAADQICEALSALDRDVDEFVRWPYPDLDTLTGPLAPGNVWFVCAPSSGGKTTFVASTIEQWWRVARKST
jgi:replicative DNA helicase